MVALQELIHERTEAERIAAQRGAYVVHLEGGLSQVLDGDGWPFEPLNSYLRDMHSRSLAPHYIRNTTYNFLKLTRECGGAGVDVLNMPKSLLKLYFRTRKSLGLSDAAAKSELSRLHAVYRWLYDEGYIDEFPYKTKVVGPSEATRGQVFIVPVLLGRRQNKKRKFLPPMSKFLAFYRALSPSAAFVCEVMLKIGLRHCELQRFAKAWRSRIRTATGVATVMVVRKGGYELTIYVPAELADRLDVYFQDRDEFQKEDGKPWKQRTLTARFTEASNAVQVSGSIIQPITGHLLRHAFASFTFRELTKLFNSGIIKIEPLLIVQELLGHASYETTFSTYIHMIQSEEKNYINNALFNLGPAKDLINALEVTSFLNNRITHQSSFDSDSSELVNE